VALYCVR